MARFGILSLRSGVTWRASTATCSQLHIDQHQRTTETRHTKRHTIVIIVIRPPDIVVGGLIFYWGTLSFFFFRQLPSELAERNSTKIGHMVGSECDLKMHVRNLGYPLPYKSGAKIPFSTTSQLNGNFNCLYLWNKTRYRQSVKCVDN